MEVILQHKSCKLSHHTQEKPLVTAASVALLVGAYGLWSLFALPGFRKVPICLKVLEVIYNILAAIYSFAQLFVQYPGDPFRWQQSALYHV